MDERNIRPMLAQNADPFDSDDHYFEPKWDGMRCIAYIRSDLVLQNRNLNNVTKAYPELDAIRRNVKSKSIILDGEIVVLYKGLPSFEHLQNRFGVSDPIQVHKLSQEIPTTYIAFDLLHLNGRDLITQPLSKRRAKLKQLIEDSPNLLLSQYVKGTGKSYFRNALQLGFEGVIAKREESEYQSGARSNDWLKLKQIRSIDAIIAGYTVGTGLRAPAFGALVLAAYHDGALKHLGNVGTGFTDSEIQRIMKLLRQIRTRTKTLPGEVKAPAVIRWVKPQLVAQVGYMNMTREGKLRMPRFERIRFDKIPTECTV